MGLFISKISNVENTNINKITPEMSEKIELIRIPPILDNMYDYDDIIYSGKINNKDRFTLLIINNRLQCIIPETNIEYTDTVKIATALESLIIKEDGENISDLSDNEYETIKYIQRLSDKIKMMSNRDNKIAIFEHFKIVIPFAAAP